MKLFYEGVVAADAMVEVKVLPGNRAFFVEEQVLKWGYRLYGEDYNLITDLETDFCAP